MPKVAPEYLAERRRRILGAAGRCFAKQGFRETTIPDICLEAGVSPGAIYRYFASKDEIIDALCAESLERDESFLDAAAQAPTTIQAFEALGNGFMPRSSDPGSSLGPRFSVQYWAEAARNPQLLERTLDSTELYVEAMADIVRRGQADGDVNPQLDPKAVARVFIAIGQGLILQMAWQDAFEIGPFFETVRALVGGYFWQGKSDLGSEPRQGTPPEAEAW